MPQELIKIETVRDQKDKKTMKAGTKSIKKQKELKENKEQQIDSLKICLNRECLHYNKLLSVITESLARLKSAIKGESLMEEHIEEMFENLYNNKVPQLWIKVSQPTSKTAADWFDDLIAKF